MIDPKLLRQSTAEVARNLARRGFEFDTDNYLVLEERRKALQVETEALRSERNSSAKSIGKAKAQGDDIAPLLAAVKDLGDRLESNESALQGSPGGADRYRTWPAKPAFRRRAWWPFRI